MKIPTLILASSLICHLSADTVYTVPQGYTKIKIAGATSSGSSSLSSISVTLLKNIAHSSSASIDAGSFIADPDLDASTLDGTQKLNVAGANWSAGQWTNTPHVVYVSNGNDAEQAFLISDNTATGEITLLTNFNLSTAVDHDKDATTPDQARFPSSTSIKIRPANTLESIFADQADQFTSDDRIFVWTGFEWSSFLRNAFGNWAPDNVAFGNANDTVIFPEEGMFVLRSATTDIEMTFFGEVPIVNQIANVQRQTFLSSRLPIDTTLAKLGLNNSDWQTDDRAFVWNGTDWVGYFINSFGNWAPSSNPFANSNNLPITGSSAVFVSREASIPAEDSAVITPLNYDPFAE